MLDIGGIRRQWTFGDRQRSEGDRVWHRIARRFILKRSQPPIRVIQQLAGNGWVGYLQVHWATLVVHADQRVAAKLTTNLVEFHRRAGAKEAVRALQLGGYVLLISFTMYVESEHTDE
jgi:hypothetical protein